MFGQQSNISDAKTTSFKVVVPFYIYAAFSFLVACILLFLTHSSFIGHHFTPPILAITHTMALGWATMIILGASHQLVPVFSEGRLFSEKLAKISFVLAAIGIPILVYSFYVFKMNQFAIIGGGLVVLALLTFLVNIIYSILGSKQKNVHAAYIITATSWLVVTAIFGLLLIFNFSTPIFNKASLHYLSLHAHIGILGWFLLLVIGVSSRLIPMFLISKYNNVKLLWYIFYLINGALLFYFLLFVLDALNYIGNYLAIALVLVAIVLFAHYCRQALSQRLRKQIDEQVKLSLLSVLMLFIPIVLLAIVLVGLLFFSNQNSNVLVAYGFMIFFGWLTAIILGMTFKTLPFIVWNKVYHLRASSGKTPNPKDLFNHIIFKVMSVNYLIGFILFSFGIVWSLDLLLNIGAVFLLVTAILYNYNVLKILNHKAVN